MTALVGFDSLEFRHVLSHLPTGVTVVAAHGPGGPVGMAANSFTSVSLVPPMILFCPARSSETWPEIRASGAFCVSIMASGHEQLSQRFSIKDIDRFDGVAWNPRETGPALSGAVAWIECQIEQEIGAGDHMVVLGKVVAIEASSDADPLVWFRGSYGSFRSVDALS